MSTWRKKAIDCLPEERRYFEQPTTTIYQVFFELLPVLIVAHEQGDTERLTKIYAFAEWCHRQNDRTLWNAAAVAFYEHLDSEPVLLETFTNWVAADIYVDLRPLLVTRFNEVEINRLDRFYGRVLGRLIS